MPRSRPVAHESLFKDQAVGGAEWAHIQSWKRHLSNFSWVSVLSGFWPIVVWLTFLAILWCLYKSVAVPRYGAPNWPPSNVVTTIYQPFSITSFALALLMVFRTNSSYARWWEARTTWGQVFNVSRNLVRQAAAFTGPEQEAAFQALCRWCAALGYILKAHLEGIGGIDEAGRNLLRASELALLASWKHRPNCAGQVLSGIVRRAVQDDAQMRVAMDEQIATYINDAGACERIMKTSIPACYTRHTSRFLMIWLTFLPVALYDICGWASPAVEAVLAFLLIGVENIGIMIEQPFGVLPMSSYCRTIAQDALEVAGQRHGLEESLNRIVSSVTLGENQVCEGVCLLKHGKASLDGTAEMNKHDGEPNDILVDADGIAESQPSPNAKLPDILNASVSTDIGRSTVDPLSAAEEGVEHVTKD